MVIQVSLTDTPLPPDADERTQLAASAWGQIANLFLSQQHRREDVADRRFFPRVDWKRS